MAHPHCPDHVRNDRELQAEFPAKPLAGMGLGSRMLWWDERPKAPELTGTS
jgi:hypothetical protein